MFYLIDFDSRSVESKTEDKVSAESYINDNGLDIAVAMIGSEDELCLQFSLPEMQELSNNLCDDYGIKSRYFDTEDEAAEFIWKALEDEQDEFPELTKALKSSKINSAEDSVASPDKPKVKRESKGVRANDLIGMTFSIGSNTPRKNTACCIFIDFLEDNLDEGTFDELVQTFIENYVPKNPDKPVDEPLGKAYVRDAYNAGFIEEAL